MAAEQEDEVLLTLKVDEGQTEEKLIKGRQLVALLTDEYTKLKKERDAGRVSAEKFAESENLILRGLTIQRNEIAANTKVLENKRKADLAAKGSIEQMQTVLSSLQDEWAGLSAEQRKNDAVGGQLARQIRRVTDELEDADKQLDQQGRTVGSYIKNMKIAGISIGETQEAVKGGAQAFGTFTKGIFTARGAMIALGAVPILLVLTGLVALLTKSQKGMDFLARATGAFSSVLSAVTNKAVQVGQAIVGAFENPRKALADFGRFVEQNLINRFKAFGVILEAIKSGSLSGIANGFLQLGTGVEDVTGKVGKMVGKLGDAAKRGVDIANINKAIEESEIALNIQRGKSLKIIESQKKLSEDVTKSAETRRVAARKADAEITKLQKSEQALQKKRIDLAQAEYDAGERTRAQEKKISEERGKYDQIAADAIGRSTELQNSINSINAEAAAKAKEDLAKTAQERVDIAERALILAKKNGEDTVELETEITKRTIDLIQARADAEIDAVEKGAGAEAKRKLIQARADSEKLEAAQAAAEKIADILYTSQSREIDASLALTRAGTKAELNLRIEAIEATRKKEQLAARARIQDDIEFAKEDARIVAQAGKAIDDARRSFDQAEVNRVAELSDLRLQTQLDLSNQSLKIEREVAAKRIDLEESTQKQLLDIELKYNQINEADYLVKLNAIQAKALAAHKELNKQIQLDAIASHKQELEDRLILVKQGSKKELDIRRQQLDDERKEAIANAKGTEEEVKKEKERINKRFNDKQTKLTEEYNKGLADQITDTFEKANATAATFVQAQETKVFAAFDRQQELALRSAGTNADLRTRIEEKFAKKRTELERDFAKKKQKIESVQNLISIARGIVEAQKNPFPLNLIQSALVAATGYAQQQIIDAQTFAAGGVAEWVANYVSDRRGAYIQGPGTGTSDSIPARISNGESILNAKSTAMFYDQLSAMNVADGGRRFPGAGNLVDQPVPQTFALGGLPQSPGQDLTGIVQAIRDLNIFVAVTDINQVDSDMKAAQAVGDY